ncbi:MAG TPA: hypothetical protein VNH44_07715 [Micropepsaceae bacterium]|nr:hypothetical protein [Micropepsaceae bacterium]
MSKKIVPFQMPKKIGDATPSDVAEDISIPEEASVDRWVHRHQTGGEMALAADGQDAAASPITITISAMPNWFDAVRLGFLPYLTVWVWTLSVAQKNLRLLKR